MRIVAVFYDVESSRKDLSQRGSSLACQQFTIPGLVRDGGLADVLAEAVSPQRRFAAVICESIDRIARFTHQGTKIEYDVELAGVPLLASDEPIILDGLDGRPGRRRKRASQVLLRRTKLRRFLSVMPIEVRPRYPSAPVTFLTLGDHARLGLAISRRLPGRHRSRNRSTSAVSRLRAPAA
jgi:hypothetical protein